MMREQTELAKRTSSTRVFRVRNNEPLEYVKRLIPVGTPHPWRASFVSCEPLVVMRLLPGVFLVEVNYEWTG
jgi:hypothetical protein